MSTYNLSVFLKSAVFIVMIYSLMVSPQAGAQTEVEYTSIEGDQLTRYAYVGERIAILVDSPDYAPMVMDEIVAVFDGAYRYYAEATGQEPALHFQYQGRATIAQVPSTCGAGCGFLGATGIEVVDSFWSILYDGVEQRGEFDQVVFFELGRNFWFYESKVGLIEPDANPIATGFAVAMRFESMDDTAVMPGPFNGPGGLDFAMFRSQVRGLIDAYVGDDSLDFNNTIRVGRSPVGWGATDLFASFYLRLSDEFGESFSNRFWREVGARPDRSTTQNAVDNIVIAASLAANENLGPRFSDTWRWPVSQDALSSLAQTFSGDPDPDNVDLQGGLSGSWFDPARSGEGFALEFGENINGPVATIYWFTHREKEPYWLIGTAQYQGGQTEITFDLLEVSGTGFGANFDSDEIELHEAGILSLEFRSCQSGFAAWETNDGETGTFELERITAGLHRVDCQ